MPEAPTVATAPGNPFDALPVGVLAVGLDGTVHQANRCLADWLGRPSDALIGQHIDQLLTHGGRVLYHTHLLPMLRQHRQVQEVSLTLKAPEGEVWVLACASMPEEAGTPLARLVLSPMRERLRVEAELLRVQQAADSAPALLFEYRQTSDDAGRFPYTSAGLMDMYRLAPLQLYEQDAPFWACLHPDDLAPMLALRAESARDVTLWMGRYRMRPQPDAPWRWHELRAQPRCELDGSMAWHGTVTDITRLHEIESLEQARAVAEQANQAKSQFLARMSHELRTPLNGILGFAQLALRDPATPAQTEQHRRLSVIEASGRQLLALINEVLDISRIEAGRLSLSLAPCPVEPVVRRVLAAVEPMTRAAGLEVQMHRQVPAGVPGAAATGLIALADEVRLAQVLSNLLSNAIKYNRPRGRITLSLSSVDERVGLIVADTGRGMDAAQCAHLFEPFNRLGAERTATEGTGLGLIITRGLVEAMGGTMSLQSRPGEGTTVQVWLRSAGEGAAATVEGDGGADAGRTAPAECAPADDPAGEAPAPTRQVLYVEDNPVNVMLMTALLDPLPGLALQIAEDGASALARARLQAPDLLLLDMHLPDMDGHALLARLRELPGLQQTPAVAVSADAMPEDIAAAKQAGFVTYWTKPLEIDRVRTELRGLMGNLMGGSTGD